VQLSPVGLVIFDNDGVVVDSELLANRVLSDLLTEHGHPTTVQESIRDYLGGTLSGVRMIIRERSGEDLPAGFDESYHRRLFEAFSTDLRPVEGIRSVLDHLELPFCLASSGTLDRIVRSLTVTGLLDYFGDRIFSAEQVANGKPAPDLFLRAASTMAVGTSHCVVIEDSPNGVAAARAAGMTVLGYAALTPAERLSGADATFATMDELLPLLDLVGR
jgi:HAD superfamily hydrolase (TIGR01509 family)